MQPIGIDQRMLAGWDDLDILQSLQPFKLIGNKLRGPQRRRPCAREDVLMLGIRKESLQLFEEAFFVLLDVLVNGRRQREGILGSQYRKTPPSRQAPCGTIRGMSGTADGAFEVECPCCGSTLQVDVETKSVIHHRSR